MSYAPFIFDNNKAWFYACPKVESPIQDANPALKMMTTQTGCRDAFRAELFHPIDP